MQDQSNIASPCQQACDNVSGNNQNAALAKQAPGACDASQLPPDRLVVSITNAVVSLNVRLHKLGAISIRFTAAVVAYSQHFGQSAVRQVGQHCIMMCMSAGNAQAPTRQIKTWLLLPHQTECSALIIRTTGKPHLHVMLSGSKWHYIIKQRQQVMWI